MPTFVAAFALQQLRDLEELQRDFGRRPRARSARPHRDDVPVPGRARALRWWRHRPLAARVAPR